MAAASCARARRQRRPELGPLPAGRRRRIRRTGRRRRRLARGPGRNRSERGRPATCDDAAPSPRARTRSTSPAMTPLTGAASGTARKAVAVDTLGGGRAAARRSRSPAPPARGGRRGAGPAHARRSPTVPAGTAARGMTTSGGDEGEEDARLGDVGEHGADVRQQLQVPVEVELAAVERLRGDVRRSEPTISSTQTAARSRSARARHRSPSEAARDARGPAPGPRRFDRQLRRSA